MPVKLNRSIKLPELHSNPNPNPSLDTVGVPLDAINSRKHHHHDNSSLVEGGADDGGEDDSDEVEENQIKLS
jgi:hypothetical protein